MILSHKIALDPNNTQRTYLARAAGTARFAYNWALAQWQGLTERIASALTPAPGRNCRRVAKRTALTSVRAGFGVRRGPAPGVTLASSSPSAARRRRDEPSARSFSGNDRVIEVLDATAHERRPQVGGILEVGNPRGTGESAPAAGTQPTTATARNPSISGR
ncbi:helix-turn-helix domain-containing protein [uncultured Thiodictyon sp.]|jgi:hypothetical protein|uniref:helix-turn-helix domain-containing protein n=1 Tax=uncultured Thiodictyon sp. TaxID=1846217 RepID=UPI00345A384E